MLSVRKCPKCYLSEKCPKCYLSEKLGTDIKMTQLLSVRKMGTLITPNCCINRHQSFTTTYIYIIFTVKAIVSE